MTHEARWSHSPLSGAPCVTAPTPARADDASYSLFDEWYEDAPLEDPARSCTPAALGAALRLLNEQPHGSARSLVCGAAGGRSGGGVSLAAQRRGVRRAADQPRWRTRHRRGCEAAPGARHRTSVAHPTLVGAGWPWCGSARSRENVRARLSARSGGAVRGTGVVINVAFACTKTRYVSRAHDCGLSVQAMFILHFLPG